LSSLIFPQKRHPKSRTKVKSKEANTKVCKTLKRQIKMMKLMIRIRPANMLMITGRKKKIVMIVKTKMVTKNMAIARLWRFKKLN